MKKVLVILILVLLVYFGFTIFGGNKQEKANDYKLDSNYVFSFSFSDSTISQIVNRTYYVYSNEKAVEEVKTVDRSTGNVIKTQYNDVAIDTTVFNINDVFKSLPMDSVSLQGVFSYELYRKDTDKTYMLAANESLSQYICNALKIVRGK